MAQRCWLPALAATALGLSWQLLTVHFNYGGNLTALFCTGTDWAVPPQLAHEHIYIFPASGGYDGQAYHYIAHDPLYRNGIGLFVDSPGTRYRRILLPGLAYLLALGQQDWIDISYFVCNLAFLFAGTWFLSRLVDRAGRNPWLSVLYLLVPSTVISLDRLTVDLALTSLALAFTWYLGTNERGKLYVVLMLAALCRDTGFFLTFAFVVPLLFRRRFRESLTWTTALIPALAWNLSISWRMPQTFTFRKSIIMPFGGWVEPFLHHPVYHLAAAPLVAVHILDWLQFAGLLLSFLLGLRLWRDAMQNPLRAACFLWACMGILWPVLWQIDPYATRLVSPLLLWQFLDGTRLPMAMVAPRTAVQLTPQVLGVLRGIFGA